MSEMYSVYPYNGYLFPFGSPVCSVLSWYQPWINQSVINELLVVGRMEVLLRTQEIKTRDYNNRKMFGLKHFKMEMKKHYFS